MQPYDDENAADGLEETDDTQYSGEKGEEAIFTCKFPGCTRQYASTDGARLRAPLARTRAARIGARSIPIAPNFAALGRHAGVGAAPRGRTATLDGYTSIFPPRRPLNSSPPACLRTG